jgi:UMF1 family MFS transporter
LISPTPSVEADDEGSFSMDNTSTQEREPMGNGELPEPQYEGEDVRLTSRKELSGWYSYGFAAEVFVICAMGKWLLFETYQDRGH